jgi:hypothetical protein
VRAWKSVRISLIFLPYRTAPIAIAGTTDNITSVSFHESASMMVSEPMICTM